MVSGLHGKESTHAVSKMNWKNELLCVGTLVSVRSAPHQVLVPCCFYTSDEIFVLLGYAVYDSLSGFQIAILKCVIH